MFRQRKTESLKEQLLHTHSGNSRFILGGEYPRFLLRLSGNWQSQHVTDSGGTSVCTFILLLCLTTQGELLGEWRWHERAAVFSSTWPTILPVLAELWTFPWSLLQSAGTRKRKESITTELWLPIHMHIQKGPLGSPAEGWSFTVSPFSMSMSWVEYQESRLNHTSS